VHFAETKQYFRNAVVTGVPVREAFFKVSQTPEPKHSPTLLIFGGSQGATAINRAVTASLPDLQARVPGLFIIHQTGERDYNEVASAYQAAGIAADVSKFIDDMPANFARADVLLCRSGASTVAEITAAGKPAIFVPFPRAADDHQKRNAEALERAGAALMLEESNLSRETLVDAVTNLLCDPARLRQMSEAARRLSHPNAAREIAEMAERLVAGSKR
jgi:UDP-N-acetylglucosamine--N-acetylmuramyl-(pentapeptide) pyrophosphoryl-undecaprenol N-acetylglucosamine transferase